MKQYPRRGWCQTLSAGVLFGIVLFSVAFQARADNWNKKTLLSVNQPVQVEDTYLEPGTYVVKLLDSPSNRHIVQIYNREENHLINTFLAIPNYRLEPTGDSRFSFYETPPGTARALRAWFYPGDNFGQQFRYPKQLRQIAMAAPPQFESRPPEPPPPPIVTQPAEPADPAPAPQPQAEPEQPKADEAPAAEVQPAPEPQKPQPETTPAAEPAKPEEPQELPKTATVFPLIGAGGLLALAGYALLRLHRLS